MLKNSACVIMASLVCSDFDIFDDESMTLNQLLYLFCVFIIICFGRLLVKIYVKFCFCLISLVLCTICVIVPWLFCACTFVLFMFISFPLDSEQQRRIELN